jgi:ABC-type proline/glycine betaine transport system permease subunit
MLVIFAFLNLFTGQLPSDEQIQKLVGFLPPFQSKSDIKIPKELRDTFEKTVSPSVDALSEAGLLPILNQVVVGFEQIPKLINEVRIIEHFFRF